MCFISSSKSKAEQYPIGILLCFFPADRFDQPHLFLIMDSASCDTTTFVLLAIQRSALSTMRSISAMTSSADVPT